MRIWSLHPQYLDNQELVACWREAFRALTLLQTHEHHPELVRFRMLPHPEFVLASYLVSLRREALKRRILLQHERPLALPAGFHQHIPVNEDQLEYEWNRLMRQQVRRNPEFVKHIENTPTHKPHPLFVVRPGRVEAWEYLT